MEDYIKTINRRSIYYFGMAIVSTIFFIIFTQKSFNNIIAEAIPDPKYGYIAIILLFFVVNYLFDRLVGCWKENNITYI
jgi:hypothetical protein